MGMAAILVMWPRPFEQPYEIWQIGQAVSEMLRMWTTDAYLSSEPSVQVR